MNPEMFNSQTLGTKGLPVFGNHAIATGREGALKEVEAAFNNLVGIVKKYTIPGNEGVLYGFGTAIDQTWGLAYKAVAGKATVS